MEVSIFCVGVHTVFTNGRRERKKLGLGTKTRRFRINKYNFFSCECKVNTETNRPISAESLIPNKFKLYRLLVCSFTITKTNQISLISLFAKISNFRAQWLF